MNSESLHVNAGCALVYIPSLVGGAYIWAAILQKGYPSNAEVAPYTSTSSNKKPLLLCSFKWKVIPKNEHAVVPLCLVSYLDENHAMKCGMQTATDCDLDVDEVQIIADWLPVPQELAFLRKVYLIIMYKACKYRMHAHCNACKEWLSEDDPLHEEQILVVKLKKEML